MIGVFDSGAGGLFALAELRRLCPHTNTVYLADKENAPYGNKDRDTLVELVSKDIERLVLFGCDTVLMACCTASSVYEFLPCEYRAVSVPIIEPTAKEAVLTSRNKRIGIISTEATEKSGAFVESIKKHEPSAVVVTAHAPELVSLAESGERDGKLSKGGFKTLEKSVSKFLDTGIDSLILGCTHFAYFENKIKEILRVSVINSARVGAFTMSRFAKEEEGKTFFI